MKKIILYLVLFLSAFTIKAQVNDPVQISAQLVPPYSTIVSDYYSADKLKIMLLNRDVSRPSVNVRLRMTIESQSVKIRTREDMAASFQTFNLSNGSPYFVSANELSSYFNADNLDFTGALSQQQYAETGKLPEGLYSFCFEAVEVNTGLVVSRKTCGFAWMTLSDPPLLNLPNNETDIPAVNPQNIIFNWTPRHTSSPNAAFSVSYKFSLIELSRNNFGNSNYDLSEVAAQPINGETRDEGNNGSTNNNTSPEQAFLTLSPIYEETVDATTLLLNNERVQLQEGSKYAWRIQAITNTGAAAFRNNGFSEIFTFTFKNDCPRLSKEKHKIEVTPYGTRAEIRWEIDTKLLEYRVQYREANNPTAEWFKSTVVNNFISISDLKPDTQYEFQIGGACEYGKFIFSELLSFETKDSRATTVTKCGDSTQIPTTVSATNLISTLAPGASFKAGDFTVFTTSVTGASTFSGNGYTEVPWLANIKVAVKFTNVQINTSNQLVSGLVETEYDPSGAGISDVDEFIDDITGEIRGGNDVGFVKTGDIKPNYVTQYPIPPGSQMTVKPNGDITIKTPDGQIHQLMNTDPDKSPSKQQWPKIIQDSDGKIIKVEKDGKFTYVGTKDANFSNNNSRSQLNNLALDKAKIEFKENPSATYAFDKYLAIYQGKYLIEKKYEKLTGVNDYWVPSKAIIPGASDIVSATLTITGTGVNEDSVKFISSKGVIYPSTRSGSSFTITLVGGPAGDAQEIFAVLPRTDTIGKYLSIGKLLVVSYQPKTVNVVVVPVNNAPVNVNALQAKLQTIYSKIGITINVTADANYNNTSWDLDNDGALSVQGSSLLSTETAEMKALQRAYKKDRTVVSKSFYLIVLQNAAPAFVNGDMPRAKQFGYLFTNGSSNLGITASHEIGHGVFKLRHPFDEFSFAQNDLTDNLMDYAGGEHLNKYQWDIVHDPGIVIGLFESDKDAEYTYVDANVFPASLRNSDQSYTFLTPAGTLITLPINVKNVFFSTYDKFYQITNLDKRIGGSMPIGSLIAFQIGDDIYNPVLNSAGNFTGYKSQKLEFYRESLSASLSVSSGIALLTTVKDGKFVGFAGKFNPSATTALAANNTGAGPLKPDLFIVPVTHTELSSNFRVFFTQHSLNNSFIEIEKLKYFLGSTDQIIDKSTQTTAESYLLATLSDNSSIAAVTANLAIVYDGQDALNAFKSCTNATNQQTWQLITVQLSTQLQNNALYNTVTPYERTEVYKLEQELKAAAITVLANVQQATQLTTAVANINDVQSLMPLLEQYGNNCALKALDIATRSKILKILIETGDDDYWYLVNKRKIIKDLLVDMPSNQEKEVVQLFKNNSYALLVTFYKEANKEYKAEISKILAPLVVKYYSQLNVETTTEPFVFNNIVSLPQINIPIGDNSFILGINAGINPKSYSDIISGYKLTATDYANTEVKWQADNKISFKQQYFVFDDRNYIKANNLPSGTRFEEIFYEYEYTPYELVNIVFVNDNPKYNFKGGETYTVPAFWAAWASEVTDDVIFWETVQEDLNIIGNAASVTAAITTFGSSLTFTTFLARADGILALADVAVQSEIKTNNNYNKEAYENWNKFRTVVGLANLANGLRRVNYKKLVNSWNKLNATLANLNISEFGIKLRNAWNEIKGLNLVQGAGIFSQSGTIQESLGIISNLKNSNKILKALGNASDLELAAIHSYTKDGNIILITMRNGSEVVIDAVSFNQFESELYQAIKSGLLKLRQTDRLVTGNVLRGRTYTLQEFNTLFNSGNVNVPLKGFVSCTKDENVAIDFLSASGANIQGQKVKVIMRIKSKFGIDIDDLSEWGINRCPFNPKCSNIQREVLLEEGYFKQIGQPRATKVENGIQWYEVDLEELGIPLRNIN